ncbi:MAG: RES domain-containing protein, partial [Moraxellaceae bacterium]
AGKPPKNTLRSEHSLFSVGYQSDQGVRLQATPFNAYLNLIAHPSNYAHTQQLGTAMRQDGVEVFEYPSARTSDSNSDYATSQATCVGLLTANPFVQNSPLSREQWFCDVSASEVMFKAVEDSRISCFELSQFLQQGIFPMPA